MIGCLLVIVLYWLGIGLGLDVGGMGILFCCFVILVEMFFLFDVFLFLLYDLFGNIGILDGIGWVFLVLFFIGLIFRFFCKMLLNRFVFVLFFLRYFLKFEFVLFLNRLGDDVLLLLSFFLLEVRRFSLDVLIL